MTKNTMYRNELRITKEVKNRDILVIVVLWSVLILIAHAKRNTSCSCRRR